MVNSIRIDNYEEEEGIGATPYFDNDPIDIDI
jgi:hypothetical protein